MLKQFRFADTELKEIWNSLYDGNAYLFPYSSYEYNWHIYQYLKWKPQAWRQTQLFYVYYRDEKPVIILPLTKKKRVLTLFGDAVSGAGALDFVYDTTVTAEDFLQALNELMLLYPGAELQLRKLNERSKFCRYLLQDAEIFSNVFHVKSFIDRECVNIHIPAEGYDAYCQNQLKRHASSNLRRIYKQLHKNEVNYELRVYQGMINDTSLWDSVITIYTKREFERTHKRFEYIKYLKYRYFSAMTNALQSMKGHYTFALYFNQQLVAFMSGLVSNFSAIIFPRLAIDSAFSKYAPGKVLISESIKWCIKNSSITDLDLSRGNEKYKYEMGGGHCILTMGLI